MKDNTKLPHSISLEMGDCSYDNHGRTETVVIRSNLSKKELEKAYRMGVKITGVDWKTEVCFGYDDHLLPEEVVKKLEPHGFKIKKNIYYEEEDGYSVWADGYALGWLFIARIGNSKFEFEIVEENKNKIYIGGYGLLI